MIPDWGVLLRAVVLAFWKAITWIAGVLLSLIAMYAAVFAAVLVLAHFQLIHPIDPPSREERARIAAVAQERLARARAGEPGTGRALTPDWRCVSTIECKRLTP